MAEAPLSFEEISKKIDQEKFDFTEVEDFRFKCAMCGQCCQRQLLHVTSEEIRRITKFIDGLPEKELEKFAFDCFLMQPDVDPKVFENYKRLALNTLKHFFVPSSFIKTKEGKVFSSFIIWVYPTSGRCIFFNPLKKRCFIYFVRPLECRIYPLYPVGESPVVVAHDDCPGVGHGQKPDLREVEKEIKECDKISLGDKIIAYNYIKEKNLHVITEGAEKSKRPSTREEMAADVAKLREDFFVKLPEALNKPPTKKHGEEPEKDINPFVELGLLPPTMFEYAEEQSKKEKESEDGHS